MFRKGVGPDLAALAEEHLKHDLRQSDRDALRAAASTVNVYTTFGSFLGIGLGLFLAYRIRGNRTAMFNAFKTSERPTAIKFSDGREQPIDLSPLLKPTPLGDFATYMLLGSGGLFIGGELGLLTGSFRARQKINQDRESRERIQTAFRRFQADALRAQANLLDQQKEPSYGL